VAHSEIRAGRWTADIEGDFVVFIIGAGVNKLRAVRSLLDLGGRRGMKYMLDYRTAHPEEGLLGDEFAGLSIIQ